METIKLPKAYPGNSYSHRITIAGIADPSTVTAVIKHGRGGRATTEQFELSTERTSGARSHDVTISRPDGFRATGVYWLEISADGQVVRTATLTISYDN